MNSIFSWFKGQSPIEDRANLGPEEREFWKGAKVLNQAASPSGTELAQEFVSRLYGPELENITRRMLNFAPGASLEPIPQMLVVRGNEALRGLIEPSVTQLARVLGGDRLVQETQIELAALLSPDTRTQLTRHHVATNSIRAVVEGILPKSESVWQMGTDVPQQHRLQPAFQADPAGGVLMHIRRGLVSTQISVVTGFGIVPLWEGRTIADEDLGKVTTALGLRKTEPTALLPLWDHTDSLYQVTSGSAANLSGGSQVDEPNKLPTYAVRSFWQLGQTIGFEEANSLIPTPVKIAIPNDSGISLGTSPSTGPDLSRLLALRDHLDAAGNREVVSALRRAIEREMDHPGYQQMRLAFVELDKSLKEFETVRESFCRELSNIASCTRFDPFSRMIAGFALTSHIGAVSNSTNSTAHALGGVVSGFRKIVEMGPPTVPVNGAFDLMTHIEGIRKILVVSAKLIPECQKEVVAFSTAP